MERFTRHLLAAACAAVFLTAALPGLAANKVEGYYEAEVAGQKDNGKWVFGPPGGNGMPKHYAELKFWSWPSDKFEVFAKVRAESNRDDERTTEVDYYHPPWFSGEGHLKLSQNKYEAYLFYRQNRFYINDDPLLHLVDDNKLKNDDWGPKAQGIRFDFWDTNFLGVKNLGGTVIISDNGGTFQAEHFERDADGNVVHETVRNPDTGEIEVVVDENGNPVPQYQSYDVTNGEDSKILRLRHKAWDNRIESGFMYLRKDWTNTSRDDWMNYLDLNFNDVVSFDVAFSPRRLLNTGLRLGPIDFEQSRWTTQMAWSRRPYEVEIDGASQYHARALAFEVRDIHIGDLTLHSWYYDFGENFRDYLSSRFDNNNEYNRIQTHVEGIYLVPLKAITTKVAYDNHYKQEIVDNFGGNREETTWYGEVYMEFINGFKARFAYRNWHGFDTDNSVNSYMTYPDWFGEISVENFLAKIRLQGRIHDAGTFRQVSAYGFDMNVNITDRLKGYLRAMNVNEATEARHTLFAQLKYDIGWGSEIYFEFGDAGQSDNLTYTDWFINESSGDNLVDRFKLLVKAWY